MSHIEITVTVDGKSVTLEQYAESPGNIAVELGNEVMDILFKADYDEH